MLELVDGVLQLAVEDLAVGDDDDGIENQLILGIVQARQSMSHPGDGIALAAAGRMLDQVVSSGSVGPCRRDQFPDRVELVVAREDHVLDLHLLPGEDPFPDFEMNEPRQNVEPAIPLPDLFPEVRALVADGVVRVPLAAVAPLVEGQEEGLLAVQASGHEHFVGIDGEMHQAALPELEQRLARVALLAVLPLRVHDRLPGEGVLQLRGRDGQAVDR